MGQALGRGRHPGRLLVRDAQGRLGQVRHPDAQRARAAARARDRGGAHVPERARVLHPRQLLHPGRGARGAALLRRRGLLLGRHRRRGWGGEGARGVDRRGPARRWISRRPTSGASRRCTATGASCASGSARSWACTTTSRSRTASSRAGAGCAARRSTSGCASAAPASGPRWAGSAPTGSRPRVSRRRRCTPSVARTGSRMRPPSTGRRARRWPSSTRPRSPSSGSRARTRRRCCSASAPTTWRCRPAGWSTPRC